MVDGVFIGAEFGWRFGGVGRVGRLDAILALKQWIAQQFGVDEGIELKMAELQQPNRLHQLRCQREPLRLPNLEPRRQRHDRFSRSSHSRGRRGMTGP